MDPPPPPALVPTEQAGRMAVKVTPFWKSNPKLWFRQLDYHFFNAGITNDVAKYHTVVGSVESDVLACVSDIVLQPPAENPYEILRRRLEEHYSEENQLQEFLDDLELGDKCPSPLVREMRDLSGDSWSYPTPMRTRGRGRGRGSRGRRGAARGRAKKNVKVIESDEEETQQTEQQDEQQPPQPVQQLQQPQDENFPHVKIDMEADISQLEAPTFTTLNRGPPEPMLRLRWDHKVSLIGEKVLNPMIHCCDKCLKPILIYGRMIPCKHVFCLACGRDEDKNCPRCMEPVTRVEQTGLGTVFMCTHGGTRYGNNGCRRTYLSQRDLQAHINHRHSSHLSDDPHGNKVSTLVSQPPPRKIQQATSQNDPRGDGSMQYRSSQSRTNLIIVPIQDQTPQPTPPAPVSLYHQSTVPGTAPVPPAGAVTPTPYPPGTGGYPVAPGPYTPPANYYSPAPPPQYPTQHGGYTDQSQYWPAHPPPPVHNYFR